MPWISKMEMAELKESSKLVYLIKPFIKELTENTDPNDEARKATLHYCEVMAERIESQWEKSPLKRENIAKIILAIEWAVLIILQIVALIVGWR